ncbi:MULTISPECIES: hypothetical protein [unclassified Meiothermus]|uniref:DUF6812 domain-containing protein n=1 Tax=unclassified Meiothermus TaxID=370471 RepID=UPI000D7BA2BA|nr:MULTISPECIES: hypothetical protein [unclassified Meiothermus]PZA06595.1 hypothetical protein DNA98_12435 [Meiothermus sp. Pnk-1]RYM37698.1 hypothetical protein EWH23_05735 [Meiothermus sp. PNK-Is4]
MYRRFREAHEVRIHTIHYRLYGMMYLIPGGGTADLLNAEGKDYLPTTGVLLYEAGYQHPPDPKDLKASADFVAVQKGHIRWLVGGRPATLRTSRAMVERRRLALLYAGYFLAGELELPKGVRLSDFLSTTKPFQTLYDVGLYLLQPRRPVIELEPYERFEFVTVNLAQVEGVLEAPAGSPEDTRLTLFG